MELVLIHSVIVKNVGDSEERLILKDKWSVKLFLDSSTEMEQIVFSPASSFFQTQRSTFTQTQNKRSRNQSLTSNACVQFHLISTITQRTLSVIIDN